MDVERRERERIGGLAKFLFVAAPCVVRMPNEAGAGDGTLEKIEEKVRWSTVQVQYEQQLFGNNLKIDELK
jgi:hypothetical protein